MKKVLVAAVVAFLGLGSSAYAQFNPGTISVGGGLSISSESAKYKYGSTTVEGDPLTTFELSPSVGYFFANDLEAGIQLGFLRESESGEYSGMDYKSVTSMALVGPYVRKYFSLGETVSVYGQAGLMFGGGKTKEEADNTTFESDNVSVFNIGITPGVMFRPSDRIGVELSAGFLGYNSMTVDNIDGDEESVTVNDFGLSLDMSNVSLGVKLFF